jgi:hypothetical protein
MKSCIAIAFLVLTSASFGQDTFTQQGSIDRQSRWQAQEQLEQFHVYSTVPLDQLKQQLTSLKRLSMQIEETLQIKLASSPIHIVILEDQDALSRYAARITPEAPSRRALYLRHRGPGLVLTYSHSDWIRDARHECTHALLDASGLALPVWQDEGLAEYFETVGNDPTRHSAHLQGLRSEVRYGQIVDMERLERLPNHQELDSKEYRDAWGAIVMLLHSSESSRKMYQAYLRDQQSKRATRLLSKQWQLTTNESWHDSFTKFYR